MEGAHQGYGLGHTFLRHVERSRVLVHLLAAEDATGEEPFAGFDLINEELRLFDPELAQKPQIEVVNKIDTLDAEELQRLKDAAETAGREVRFISALRGDGVEELMVAVWRLAKPLAAQSDDGDETEED